MSTQAPSPSLRELQAALPAHLREIRPGRALGSLLLSLGTTGGLLAVGFALAVPSFEQPWSLVLWLPLSVAIGVAAGGLWVIGHECGHGSFLRPVWLEQALGFLVHTFFLSPYVAWRRSHQMHHRYTNHLGEDIAYVPLEPGSLPVRIQETLRRVVGRTAANVIFQLSLYLFGYPIYLLFGMPGKMAWVSHFLPRRGDFLPTRRLRRLVALNTLVYVAWLAALILATIQHPAPMLFAYFLPLAVVNFFLLFYTLMHHTHPEVPWYGPSAWTPARGALATIDRRYGRVLDLLHHNIGRYHVYHHVDSRIPHYHGQEATEILRAKFPELYHRDDRSPFWWSWQVGNGGLTKGTMGPVIEA